MAIKVKAVRIGFYGQLRQPDDEFEVKSKSDVGKWMKVIGSAGAPASDGGEEQPKETAKELIEQINNSDDVEFIMSLKSDTRATVRKAAEERLAALSEG